MAAAAHMTAAMAAINTRRMRVSPGGAGAFACEARGLAGDGAALADPGRECVERGRIDTGRVGAMVAHPALHGREQLRRELAIAAEQREVRILGLAQAVQAEVGVAAVLDGLGVIRLQPERAVIGRERSVVVAELAI